MKPPKTFTPEKNLDKHIERLLKKPDLKSYNEATVGVLLKKCKTFIDKQTDISNLLRIYQVGEDLSQELDFTKYDVEEASQRIEYDSKDDRYAGFYLSALVNKTLTGNNVMKLKFYGELSGVGAYLKTGTLIVDGYVNFALGHCMEGGNIIVKNGTGNDAGNGMQGGKIIINGDAGTSTGIFSKGGDIAVYGSIGKIADSCKARVFQRGKQIWPR